MYKYLTLRCYDYNRFTGDVLIGQTSVRLDILATGPKHHHLTLKQENGEDAGAVSFQLTMSQVCKDMQCKLSNVSVPRMVLQGPESVMDIILEYNFSEDKDQVQASVGRTTAGGATWMHLSPFSICTDMETLVCQKCTLQLRVMVGARLLGEAQINVLDFYVVEEDSVSFKTMLHNPSGLTWELTGAVSFLDGPFFAQMQGEPPDVLHHDQGITCNSIQLTGFPLPPGFKLPAPKGAAARRSSLSAQNEAGGMPAPVQLQKHYSSPDVSQPQWQEAPVPAMVPARGDQDLHVAPAKRRRRPEHSSAPLPRYWSQRVAQDGTVYFAFAKHDVQQTTYQDPRFLPAGWEQLLTLDGRAYYARAAVEATTWVDPRGLPPHWSLQLEKGGHVVFEYEENEGGSRPPSASKDGRSTRKGSFSNEALRCAVDPRGLPEGFRQRIKPGITNRVYFENTVHKSSTWDDPRQALSSEQCLQLLEAEREKWMSARFEEVSAERANELAESEKKIKSRGQSRLEIEAVIADKAAALLAERRAWLAQHEEEWAVERSKIVSRYEHQTHTMDVDRNNLEVAHEAEVRVFDTERPQRLANGLRRIEADHQTRRQELLAQQSAKWHELHEERQVKLRDLYDDVREHLRAQRLALKLDPLTAVQEERILDQLRRTQRHGGQVQGLVEPPTMTPDLGAGYGQGGGMGLPGYAVVMGPQGPLMSAPGVPFTHHMASPIQPRFSGAGTQQLYDHGPGGTQGGPPTFIDNGVRKLSVQ